MLAASCPYSAKLVPPSNIVVQAAGGVSSNTIGTRTNPCGVALVVWSSADPIQYMHLSTSDRSSHIRALQDSSIES